MPKRKIRREILVVVGYLLSPLSWWNDIFINIPIAYAVGFLFGLVSRQLFFPFMVFGYWGTNVLGLVLMHSGISEIASKSAPEKYTKRKLAKDLLISVIYTLAIAALAEFKILKFPFEYFQ